MKILALVFLMLWSAVSAVAQPSDSALATFSSAKEIIAASISHWRGLSSYNEMTMTIHRPDWQRSMSMQAWTEGDKLSLIRVTAPKKDRGNASLLKGSAMWSYSPKINRVIKVPSSMMGQSWMGSDFSNRDVARSDDLVDLYQHTLLKTEQRDGHNVYTIEALPKPDAAVVWGREVLQVRDDLVLIQHQFFDQDDILVKVMLTSNIATLDGRVIAQKQRMSKLASENSWTEISVQAADFDIKIPSNMFTLSNLRNPR